MFLDKIKENCRKLSDKTAYISGNNTLTYNELWEKANNLAGYLCRTAEKALLLCMDIKTLI